MTDTDGSLAALTDDELSRTVAIEAADLLMVVRAEFPDAAGLDATTARTLGDEGDLRANNLIIARLKAARPDDAILSEESFDDGARVTRPRVWIVDPLDGTAEFRTGRDEFAVHVALWQRVEGEAGQGVEAVLRASTIALPDRQTVRSTGAWATLAVVRNSTGDDPTPPVALDLDGPIVLVISRNHLPRGMEMIMARLGELLAEAGHPDATVEISQVGSVGAKVDEVLLGKAAAYVFSGGLKEWDAAAPFAVAAQCGYVVQQVDGTPFEYNRLSPVVGSGFVAHPLLADMLAEAVAHSGL